MLSLQIRSGASSSQYGPVVPGAPWWNDRRLASKDGRQQRLGSEGTACSGLHDWQCARRPAGIGSDLGQLLMKGVMAILIKQRQVH